MNFGVGKRSRDDGHLSKEEYEAVSENAPVGFTKAGEGALSNRRMVRAKKVEQDKKEQFAKHIQVLNQQFKNWFKTNQKKSTNDNFSAGLQDYIDYVNQLQERYLRTAGEVLTFGSGDCGQLAHGVEEDSDLMVKFPRIVSSLRDKKVAMISCGGLHNAVATEDGLVYTWGCADDGSLGRVGDENIPGLVEELSQHTVLGVACGDTQTFCYTVTGEVFGWGCFRDKEGKKFFNPTYKSVDDSVDILSKDVKKQQDLVIQVKGFASANGSTNKPGAVEMACGSSSCVVRCEDGSVYSWGLGELGELGRGKLKPLRNSNGDYMLKDIVHDHITPKRMQARVGSNVVYVGDRKHGVSAKTIGCGAYHTLVVLVDSGYGRVGDGCEAIYTCGLNNYGQLGLGDDSEKNADAGVLIQVKHAYSAVDASGVTSFPRGGIVSVAGGVHHSLALCQENGVSMLYAWGRSDSGQVGIKGVGQNAGDGVKVPRHVPLPVNDDVVIKQIACGGNHNLVLCAGKQGENSEIYSWGYGDMLALGHGREQDERVPKRIQFERSFGSIVATQVAGGGQHSAIIAQVTVVK